jgi:PhzF family phenazine biosynthesis protein
MQIPLYQVDAFASKLFEGNPAAVCPLTEWLDDATLQALALENNLSETAFLVEDGDGYRLRWFTPTTEVDLCGHATLASAHVVFNRLRPEADAVRFATLSGELTVTREGDRLTMDFPAVRAKQIEARPDVAALLGSAPAEAAFEVPQVHGAEYLMLVYASRAEVAGLAPRFAALDANVIATAPADPGDELDFVSRFFAPAAGIDEDPVTGSAHCTLGPYWADRLARNVLRARQISPRGGNVGVEVAGDRVRLTGSCVDYLEGRFRL